MKGFPLIVHKCYDFIKMLIIKVLSVFVFAYQQGPFKRIVPLKLPNQNEHHENSYRQ